MAVDLLCQEMRNALVSSESLGSPNFTVITVPERDVVMDIEGEGT